MRAYSAAPGASDSGAAGSSRGDRQSIAQLGLPAHVVETLAREGVHDLADWTALGRRRLRIWGVTRRTVTLLDAAAREADR